MNRQNKPSREATQLTLWIAGLSRNEKIKFSALATPAVRPPERPWCGMKFIFDKKNGSLVVEIRFVGRFCFFFDSSVTVSSAIFDFDLGAATQLPFVSRLLTIEMD